MVFWEIKLEPGIPYRHNFEEPPSVTLHVTQASLDIFSVSQSIVKSDVHYVKVGDDENPILLCSLEPGEIESCSLDFQFKALDGEVLFLVHGPRSVHLTGFYIAKPRPKSPQALVPDKDMPVTITTRTKKKRPAFYGKMKIKEEDLVEIDDPEMFPPRPPSSNSAVLIEEIEDAEKVVKEKVAKEKSGKKKTGSRKKRKADKNKKAKEREKKRKADKKIQTEIEETEDDEKPTTGNGSRLSVSDGEDKKPIVAKGGNNFRGMESEDEDGVPISSQPESIATAKSNEGKSDKKIAKEKKIKKAAKEKSDKKKEEDGVHNGAGIKRKIDSITQDGEAERASEKSEDSSKPSTEIEQEKSEKTKKKKKVRA